MRAYMTEVDKCFERIEGRRLAMNPECLRPLVSRSPEATYRYVEMYCAMAYAQPSFLKIPYVLALLYDDEHNDKRLVDLVWKTANEIGGTEILQQISFAKMDDLKKEPPERDAARNWWEEIGSQETTCDVCDERLRRGEGFLIESADKKRELLCRRCFDRR
jgi:hypothetical protein